MGPTKVQRSKNFVKLKQLKEKPTRKYFSNTEMNLKEMRKYRDIIFIKLLRVCRAWEDIEKEREKKTKGLLYKKREFPAGQI